MLREWCALGLLLVPSAAYAWPTAEQWIPVTQGGSVVVDEATTDAGVDIVGDTTLSAFSWYAENQTIWFAIRVATDRYDVSSDMVGIGLRTPSEDVVVTLDALGVRFLSVDSGEWCPQSEEDFGVATTTGLESLVTEELDTGTTWVQLKLPVSEITNTSSLSF